ncbi:helix-turn-helix domain-containing protein [Halorhodospira neutriphila]|nr:helix-turn-helix transcriptional regulator [Halorhodospira neutriphila]
MTQSHNHERTMEILAIRLRKLRQKARLTQRELAERAGVQQAQLSRAERTGRSLSTKAMQAIACELGTTLSYLYGEEDGEAAGSSSQAEYVPPTGPDTPRGLREIAASPALCEELDIQPVEWQRLLALELPSDVRQEDCLELLLVLRRVYRRSGRSSPGTEKKAPTFVGDEPGD